MQVSGVRKRSSRVYYIYTRTTPKRKPPILLCWPTSSEVNLGGMAVEYEPFYQYSAKVAESDGSREAV